jgi:DNA polymerase-3 subunit alpha
MFANLHVHTDYSVLDGALKIDAGVRRAVQLGQSALAITDHGTLGGAYALVKSARTHGINPIIGLEAYVAPHDRTHREAVWWGTPEQRADDLSGGGKYCHLTLLARDAEGLRNLYRLQHDGYATGFYGKPRIDFDSLSQHSGGITCLTGCVSGHVQTALRLGRWDIADQSLGTLEEIFGEHLYVEIMDHNIAVEQKTAAQLLELAARHQLPLIATADSHFTLPEDRDTHDVLLCVQTKAKKADVDRFRFDGAGYHLASFEEMAVLFGDLPSSLHNTQVVARSVEGYGDFFDRKTRFPKYSDNEEADLLRLAIAGCPDTPEHIEQVRYEVGVINSQGYAGYFLRLMEAMQLGRAAGIRFGPGRGSAGGSLVAFSLGITGLDPLVHGLLFERFLNPERISLPDIDVDVDDRRRDEFVGMLRDKYGEAFVAHVGTYGIIKAKSALKDSVRVLGHPYILGERLVSKLPPPKFGRQPALADLPSGHGAPADILEAALGLEGTIRTSGTHASAVLISPEPLVGLVPTKIPRSKPVLTTEFTGTELDELGFVKYDFLGVKTIGVIDETLHLLSALPRPGGEPPVELPRVFDDSDTFDTLSRGKTTGVFQLDGYGMRKLLRSVRPESLEDVAAVLALYRPGPMGANAHNEFAERKRSRLHIEYPHHEYASVLADILSPTYGLIVFQEQVLKILAAVGGYTYATAGLIFDAMRKKDTQKMLAARPDFQRRLTENGYSKGAIDTLWDTLVPFSDYSFNKAHSTAYAMVSYWTAYLKTHHPKEFYCALLSYGTDAEDLTLHLQSAIEEGVTILSPDINSSQFGWSTADEGILFGLGSVKGISQKTYSWIALGRPYNSMEDFWQRAHPKVLNAGVLSAAIRSGAFDQLEPDREQLFANLGPLAARALADRELEAQGHTRLWTSFDLLPGQPRMALRQEWETEVLGISLTRRAVDLHIRGRLKEEEMYYLRDVLGRNPGPQPVNVHIGDLTVLKDVGRVSLTPQALLALGDVVDVQEEA